MTLPAPDPDARPAQFPRIAAVDMALGNLLATRRPVLRLPEGAPVPRFALTQDAVLGHGTAVLCAAEDARLAIRLPDDIMRRLTPEAVADLPLAALPEALAEALADLALAPLLAALTPFFGVAPSVAGVGPSPAAWRALGLSAGSGPAGGALSLSPEAEQRITAALTAAEPCIDDGWAAAVPVALSAVLRGPRLDMATLRGLAPGAVVLAAPGATLDAAQLRAGARGRRVGVAAVDGGKLAIVAWNGAPMTEEEPPGQPQDSPLDAIEMQVDFLLGRRTMPFADLRALAPGVVLPLDGDAEDPVALVVEGQTIGHGDLVRIGDRLGVRIRRLVRPAAQPAQPPAGDEAAADEPEP